MDGAVPSAQRSQAKLPDGSQPELVLLLRLWPWWRCDPFCRALLPGEVPAGPGATAPMAWLGPFTAGSREFLSPAVTPSRRGGRLSAATRSPLAGADRAHADRLCARRLPARLADAVGLPTVCFASSRLGHDPWIRHLHTAHRLPVGRQSLWTQPLGFGATSSVLAGHKRRLVCRSKSGNTRT
jgi:hypothetical protein